LQVAYGKELQSASNMDKEVHTNLPFIYGEYDPILAASNKYAANSVVYVEESGNYYILINQRHQIDERSWEVIHPMKEDLASESKYKPNDLVVYKNTVLLLKSPFNQLEPTSWIEIPINGKAKQKAIYEIEKAKKVEEDEKRRLSAMRNKMHKLKEESLKYNVPHRFPTDNCIYHAFDTESTVKKMLCGTPIQINLKDGINIFETPLPEVGLNPYILHSKSFQYGVIDRCGRLQKYLTFSIRNATRIRLKMGNITILPPFLVGQLDCYNHDCQVFMCSQEIKMARVVSANLYVQSWDIFI